MFIVCKLCPKRCLIPEGGVGDCKIRVNINGQLKAITYEFPCAIHIDPIEKKPLFHFYPGSRVFSIATVGCNLHCLNCQNWEISQAYPHQIPAYHLPIEKLIELVIYYKCPSIAYTYTEPLVYYEYTLDTSIAARRHGIKNILVTAAYLNKEPFKRLIHYIDAANIDLKGFSERFYRKITTGSLKVVLNNIILAKEMGVWIEITNLLIPGFNDTQKMITSLVKWHKKYLGEETPLHFSRFFPQYKMKNIPYTPYSSLKKARDIALSAGLKYVYIGNIPGIKEENTYCPSCKKVIIRRVGYKILDINIKESKCIFCGYKIAGIF